MPDFKATLYDTGGILQVTLNSTSTGLDIVDQSNYAASTESGHLQADFSTFRRILVTRPDGTTYNFSSIGDGDGATVVGASAATDTYTFLSTDNDGLWKVKLVTVPTYNAAATYEQSSDYVYYNGVFYQSLVGSNTGNTPDASPSEWGVVAESALSSKYAVEEYIAVQALEICPCMTDKLDKWITEASSNVCADSHYRKDVLDLIAYDRAVTDLMQRQAYTKVENVLNAMISLCRC